MPGRASMPAGVSADYDLAAPAWGQGASLVYGPLARALVATGPVGLAGRLVLDVGAGTGVASAALLAAGARPLAVDLSHGMLAWRRAERPPAVVGDVLALPVASGAAGGAVAAFVLNHLEEPVAALAELARVVAPGGPVLASVYSNAEQTEVKQTVDAVVAAWGWTPPDWYLALKERGAPQLGTPRACGPPARSSAASTSACARPRSWPPTASARRTWPASSRASRPPSGGACARPPWRRWPPPASSRCARR